MEVPWYSIIEMSGPRDYVPIQAKPCVMQIYCIVVVLYFLFTILSVKNFFKRDWKPSVKKLQFESGVYILYLYFRSEHAWCKNDNVFEMREM